MLSADQYATWTLDLVYGVDAGTLVQDPGPPDNPGVSKSAHYAAPSSPPIYPPPYIPFASNPPPGTAKIIVWSLPIAGSTFGGNYSTDTLTVVITSPTVTVNINPAAATVALGSTQNFYICAVGNIDGALTLDVNGVVGGSAATGTIAHPIEAQQDLYVYSAPSVMPMAGSTVSIRATSNADPTKTASAVITLH